MGPGCCSLQGCSCAIASNTTTGASPSPRGPPGQAVPTTRVTPPATPRSCAPLAQGCTPTPMYPKCPGVAALSQSGPGDLLLSQAGTPPQDHPAHPCSTPGKAEAQVLIAGPAGHGNTRLLGTGAWGKDFGTPLPDRLRQASKRRSPFLPTVAGSWTPKKSWRSHRDSRDRLWEHPGPRPRRGDVTDSNSWLRFRNVSSDLSTGLPPDETPRSHTSLLATA